MLNCKRSGFQYVKINASSIRDTTYTFIVKTTSPFPHVLWDDNWMPSYLSLLCYIKFKKILFVLQLSLANFWHTKNGKGGSRKFYPKGVRRRSPRENFGDFCHHFVNITADFCYRKKNGKWGGSICMSKVRKRKT